MKKTIALILAALMALSLVACGGEMPEAPIETPSATPETVTTPVESEPITPDNSVEPDLAYIYQLLEESISVYRSVYIYDCAEYLSESDASKAHTEMDYVEMLEKLGYPHFEALSFAGNKPYATIGIYIMTDAQILEMGMTLGKPTSIVRYSAEEYVKHITEEWSGDLIVHSDPAQSYTKVFEALEKRQYMQISDRTDYPSSSNAKRVTDLISIDDMIALLGEPHFMQVEPKPHNGTNSMIMYVYILSDGSVCMVEGAKWNSKASYAQIHPTDYAIGYLSHVLYY